MVTLKRSTTICFLALIGLIFSGLAKAEASTSQAILDQELVSAVSSQDDWTAGTSYSINFWQRKESKGQVEHKVLNAVRQDLAAGANANAFSPAGESAVAMAAYREYTDVVSLLLDKGANAKSVVLSRIQSYEIIHILLSYGADVNVIQPGHWSGFAWFIASGRVDVVTDMIHHGADVNRGDDQDDTPIILAAHRGYFDIFRLLVLNRADIHVDHDLVLSYASMAENNNQILQYLINAGMSVNGTSCEPGGPLTCAAYYGSLDSVQFLLAHGANPNLKDRSNRTPVTQAREGAKGHHDSPDTILDALHNAGATDL